MMKSQPNPSGREVLAGLVERVTYGRSFVAGENAKGSGHLRQSTRTGASIDNPFGLRKNFLFATFLQIGGAIS